MLIKNFLLGLLLVGVLSLCSTKGENWAATTTDYVLAIEHARKVGYKYPDKFTTHFDTLIFWDWPSCPPLPKVMDYKYPSITAVIEKRPHYIVFIDKTPDGKKN